eukprot:TRINITY_DN20103_c0_g1_i1.p1 TRINITY_DN20103_c0_g1~~TRINITY_DN20103_c0_g1_i1.p1  ORF type:complete len:513 (+),score=81.69 TRINITY_DN20103_c0_g1_i1:85-1623(+)
MEHVDVGGGIPIGASEGRRGGPWGGAFAYGGAAGCAGASRSFCDGQVGDRSYPTKNFCGTGTGASAKAGHFRVGYVPPGPVAPGLWGTHQESTADGTGGVAEPSLKELLAKVAPRAKIASASSVNATEHVVHSGCEPLGDTSATTSCSAGQRHLGETDERDGNDVGVNGAFCGGSTVGIGGSAKDNLLSGAVVSTDKATTQRSVGRECEWSARGSYGFRGCSGHGGRSSSWSYVSGNDRSSIGGGGWLTSDCGSRRWSGGNHASGRWSTNNQRFSDRFSNNRTSCWVSSTDENLGRVRSSRQLATSYSEAWPSGNARSSGWKAGDNEGNAGGATSVGGAYSVGGWVGGGGGWGVNGGGATSSGAFLETEAPSNPHDGHEEQDEEAAFADRWKSLFDRGSPLLDGAATNPFMGLRTRSKVVWKKNQQRKGHRGRNKRRRQHRGDMDTDDESSPSVPLEADSGDTRSDKVSDEGSDKGSLSPTARLQERFNEMLLDPSSSRVAAYATGQAGRFQ